MCADTAPITADAAAEDGSDDEEGESSEEEDEPVEYTLPSTSVEKTHHHSLMLE